MRRASRGRLVAPVSCSEVVGKDALSVAGCEAPFTCDVWVLGCVDDCVGGLGLGALDAVAGGVEMPFGMLSAAAGDAMLSALFEVVVSYAWGRCRLYVKQYESKRAREAPTQPRPGLGVLRLCMGLYANPLQKVKCGVKTQSNNQTSLHMNIFHD